MSSQPRFPISIGDRFGGTDSQRFEVQAQAGLGGQAVVFRCLDTRLNRQVAAKVSTAMNHGDRQMSMERFERELQLSSRVNHPHVLQVYDCGELPDGSPYVLLEWMPHGAMSGLVEDARKQGRYLPLHYVHYYATALAAAMRAVHATQMIHRDIKPENVLIGADGVSKLTDFGIAKDISPNAVQLTEVGQTLGTLGFMAPEQLSGLPGPMSDIFSFGVSVYLTLMGRMPEQVTQNAIPLGRITEDAWAPVPEPYRTFLEKCTAFELSERYLDFDEVLEALRGIKPGKDTRPQVAAEALPPLPSGAFVTGSGTNPGSRAPVPLTEAFGTADSSAQTGGVSATRAMGTQGMADTAAIEATGSHGSDEPGVTRVFHGDELDVPRKSRGPMIAIAAAVLLLGGGGGLAAALMSGGGDPPPAEEIVAAALNFDTAVARGDAAGAAAVAAGLPASAAETNEGRLLLAQDALAAGDYGQARQLAAGLGGLGGAGGALAALVEGASTRLERADGYAAAAAAYGRAAECSDPACKPLAARASLALGDLCRALPAGAGGCAAFPPPTSTRDAKFARSAVLRADGHTDEARKALAGALSTPLEAAPSCLEVEVLRSWADSPKGLDSLSRAAVADAGKAASRDADACRTYGGLTP